MTLVNLVGAGDWFPTPLMGFWTPAGAAQVTLDADEEEIQMIGRIKIDGGGSKTFGTSGSKIDWLPGTTITFLSGSTVRVGVKQVSLTTGPPGRAVIGAAAFDVYDDLVGGTDTITSTTWRSDPMSAGTPFTVTNGDLLAICLHLDTSSGTPNVKIRGFAPALIIGMPLTSLVTSGPTHTLQTFTPNIVLTFDDGTLGWIEGGVVFSVADVASANVGNTNIFGNIFRRPFPCAIDALAANVGPTTSGANFSLALYSTPLGTPALVEAVSFDANVVTTAQRMQIANLTTPRTLLANTDYAIGVRQDTATGVTVLQYDVNDAAHFKPNGMGAECYGATSTAAATFAAINSGKRRYHVYARISQLDDGAAPIGRVTGARSIGTY